MKGSCDPTIRLFGKTRPTHAAPAIFSALVRGRAQAAQSAMVEQLMAILKNSPVGIVITRERRFELVGSHAHYLFGYPEGELLGLDAGVIYPSPEAYLAVIERYRAAFKTQGSFDGDVQMRRKDGSSLLVRMRGRCVIDGDPRARIDDAGLVGDEFAILLPGCTLKRVQKIAEQVRSGIDSWRMDWREHAFRLGTSIGVVQLSRELSHVAAVLESADSACYEAKHRGRNRVVTYGDRVPAAA